MPWRSVMARCTLSQVGHSIRFSGGVGGEPSRPPVIRRAHEALRCLTSGSGESDRLDATAGSRRRSEEHTSELPSLMRITDAVFCLDKQKHLIDGFSDSKQTQN